ncbi:MAG: hypothetical protein GTN73_06035 [Candidatus Aminicenantes bacterium]|nr:hypothetical protein [Candidatus Aminicenantes bacterium]
MTQLRAIMIPGLASRERYLPAQQGSGLAVWRMYTPVVYPYSIPSDKA